MEAAVPIPHRMLGMPRPCIPREEVILTAWRVLFRCASADEAEAQACAQGLCLASQWCPGPIIVELDSTRIVSAMSGSGSDRSELIENSER